MITTGTKLYIAIGIFGLVAAGVYGVGSGGDCVGVLSLGFKGGVGEHLGYSVLLTFGAAAMAVGSALSAFRDADAAAQVGAIDADVVPRVQAPSTASPWPIAGAFGAGIGLLGLVVSPPLFWIGLVMTGIVIVEWTVQVWADRATGDTEVNRAIRNRLMLPVEVPAIALIGIGVLVFAASRILLSLTRTGAVVAAIAITSLIFMVGALAAWRPKVGASLVSAVLVLGAVGMLAGGIVAAAIGEREFHEEEGGEETEVTTDESTEVDPAATTETTAVPE